MNVSPISHNKGINFTHANRDSGGVNPVTWTGYGAVAFGVASGIAASKKKIKLHKNLAYVAGGLTLLHLGVVEFHKFQYRQKQKNLSQT